MQQSNFPISFVIITDGTVDSRIQETIDSIQSQMNDFQIIVVGGNQTSLDVDHIPFDEARSPRPWITRKKNLANSIIKNDVVVWMHDYHVFDENWYGAMVEFGLDWDIQMNQVRMITGHRMFDWVNISYPNLPSHFAIPYDRSDIIQHQYIPGGYWVSKKHVTVTEPQNENLLHFDLEDVEWSRRVLPKFKYVMNQHAVVRHNKIHRECSYVGNREAEHSKWSGWE